MFRDIKGQSSALQILLNAIDNDRIAQAYLFHGSDGVGKLTTALYFGMALNCLSKSEYRPCGVCSSCRKFLAFDHPDLLYVFPSSNLGLTIEGEIKDSEKRKEYDAFIRNKIESPWEDYFFSTSTEIRKESINWMIKRLDLSRFEATYRICIIEGADQMNIPTANAFLKTLEEPPEATVIILITDNLSQLLPTIVSRCQPVYFQSVTPHIIEGVLLDKFNVPLEQARIASHIADGSVKRAIHLVRSESSELRDRAYDIFRMAADDNDLAYMQSLKNTAKKFNSEAVIELIKYLCLFVGDLNKIENSPEQVVNIDKTDFLTEVRQRITVVDDAEITDRVFVFLMKMEDYIKRIQGNANLQLIMTNLYLQLNKVLRG